MIRRSLGAAWVALSGFVAYLVAGMAAWAFVSNEYCGPEDGPDPILSCAPTWEQNPWAIITLVALGMAVFGTLTAPLWLGRLRRSGQRP